MGRRKEGRSTTRRIAGKIVTDDDKNQHDDSMDDTDDVDDRYEYSYSSKMKNTLITVGTQKGIGRELPWTKLDDSAFHSDRSKLEVCVNVVMLNLGDISTSTLSYRMRLELWVAWPLTKEEVHAYYEDPKRWQPNVHPDPIPWTISIETLNKMTFLNGRTTQVFLWRGKVVACECTLVTALYQEAFDLSNFPLDCQHLNFSIGIRSDCDMPLMKDESNELLTFDLAEVGGYLNFDGRAMAPLEINEHGCTFNVRTHLLCIEEFNLEGIECKVDNTKDDIPFLRCSVKISRNYFPYLFRIFLPLFIICINATLSYRFAAGLMDSRLNYIATNLLTIIAFFFIISSILPEIPYLTVVDKYMTFSICYVLCIGIACVILEYVDSEHGNADNGVFIFSLAALGIGHIIFGIHLSRLRHTEFLKNSMSFIELREKVNQSRFENEALLKKNNEFLVHSEIHPKDSNDVHLGTLRSLISPVSAQGWLHDVHGGKLLEAHEVAVNDGVRRSSANEFKFLARKNSVMLPLISKT